MRRFRIIYTALTAAGLAAGSMNAQTTITDPNGGTVTTSPSGAAGVSIKASSTGSGLYPDVKVTVGPGTSSAFRIFNTASTECCELLRVQSDGNVGIGTTSASYPLDLSSNVTTPFRINGTSNPGLVIANGGMTKFSLGIPTANHNFIANSAVNDVALRVDSGGKMLFSSSAIGATNDLTLSGGNVGIGTTNPVEILTVRKAAAPTFLGLSGAPGSHTAIVLGRTAGEARLGIASTNNGEYAQNASTGDAILRVDSASQKLHLLAGWGSAVMTITSANVGIGVAAPAAALQIETPSGPNYPARFQAIPGIPNGVMLEMTGNGEIDVSGLQIGRTGLPYIQSTGQSSLYLNPTTNNNVVIGNPSAIQGPLEMLNVAGNINVSGNINAKYQDLAEWVPATEAMPPGTVVVVERGAENTVTPSTQRYDTRVAGVVSAQPGVLLGIQGPSKAMIATTGRVKVRVDASNAPIHMGDLLVTSDKPGVAMRSEVVDLGGVKIHRPGTLIGKALEPLASGEGEILVLLSLQ